MAAFCHEWDTQLTPRPPATDLSAHGRKLREIGKQECVYGD